MRIQPTALIALAAATVLWPASAFAKRRAPSPVSPVVWQGVEYRTPLEQMDHVQAFDLSTGRKLWDTEVYHVWINPGVEEDAQCVFISNMQVQDGKLLVRNEDGKSFRLDLKTGRIEGAMRYWMPWFVTGGMLLVLGFLAWLRALLHSQQGPANFGADSVRYLGIISSLVFLSCTITGCLPDSRPHLVVGMELAYPPFEMIDTQGRPAGVSVDLALALGQSLGKEVQIVNIPFDGLIPSLQTHKIDLIISSMTATAERAKSIAFSDPYLQTGLCLLVGKDSPIQSIEDADQPGRTIVVKRGTTGHIYATDHVKKARLLVVDKEDACVLEVVQGKADAFIYDQISTYENWRRNQETTRPILKSFQQESWAIGLRLDDAERLAKVNHFLKDYKERGGFEQLGDRYLKDQKEAFRKLGYPFYF